MRRTIRCDRHAPAKARQHVSAFLKRPDVSTDVVNDVVLAVSELVTNAVEAGATSIELCVDVTKHDITMSVDDDTAGWPTLAAPDPNSTRGRGLAIVAKTADNWDVERTRQGKKVTACFATNRADV
jgi:anti-sigma regulatory factor (Ser/Thr protein kinase)